MDLNMNANLIATEISNDDPFEQSEAVRHLAAEFLILEKLNEEKAKDILNLKDKLRFLKPFFDHAKDQLALPDNYSKLVDDKFWDLI